MFIYFSKTSVARKSGITSASSPSRAYVANASAQPSLTAGALEIVILSFSKLMSTGIPFLNPPSIAMYLGMITPIDVPIFVILACMIVN